MKKINTSEAVVKELLKNIGWHLFDKSGLRLIWEKFNPPKEKDVKRKPSTILFWAFGLYFALYGITATRYENKINKIENHANIVIAQLGSKNYKNALAMIPSVQNRTVPYEPDVLNPLSVIYSWDNSKDTLYYEVVERLKDVVVAWKGDLDSVDLSNAYLVEANLMNADLENADLMNANLENATLREVNLKNAYLRDVNLENADLFYADFENADLTNVKLENATLREVNLKNANLEYANIKSADLRSTNLENANLSQANLDSAILLDVNLENANLRESNLIGIITSMNFFLDTDETRNDFIKELEKAKNVEDIKLDEKFVEIIMNNEEEYPMLYKEFKDRIEEEYPELYKRIKEEKKNKLVSNRRLMLSAQI